MPLLRASSTAMGSNCSVASFMERIYTKSKKVHLGAVSKEFFCPLAASSGPFFSGRVREEYTPFAKRAGFLASGAKLLIWRQPLVLTGPRAYLALPVVCGLTAEIHCPVAFPFASMLYTGAVQIMEKGVRRSGRSFVAGGSEIQKTGAKGICPLA